MDPVRNSGEEVHHLVVGGGPRTDQLLGELVDSPDDDEDPEVLVVNNINCIEKGQPERENVENKGKENHGDKADDRKERNTDIEDVLDPLEEARE